MAREGVLHDEVENRPRTVDIEFGPIHFVHLHPAHRHPDHLRITEVLRAMGGEGHRGSKRCDQSEIDQMRAAVMDDDVVGFDILVPETVAVIPIKRRDQVDLVTEHFRERASPQSIFGTDRVRFPHDGTKVVTRVIGHGVPELRVIEFVGKNQSETLC